MWLVQCGSGLKSWWLGDEIWTFTSMLLLLLNDVWGIFLLVESSQIYSSPGWIFLCPDFAVLSWVEVIVKRRKRIRFRNQTGLAQHRRLMELERMVIVRFATLQKLSICIIPFVEVFAM